ncbi:glycosyltransferase [Streptomyces sp. NPDC088116]|uniref:glycosyltransferase n=1 Tax=Streptomyces sp. NPDC088116 TaxID=3365825 RepID=UPI00381AB0B5
MIPTAQALRSAGHDVLFGALPPVDLLRPAGLPAVEVGDGSTLMDAFRQEFDGPVPYVDEGQPREERMRIAVRGFVRHGRTAVPGLLRLAEAWRPDILVHDAFHAGAPLVAAALGIPTVVHNFGVTSGPAPAGLMAAELADDYRAHGVTAPADRTVLDVVPASLGGDGTGWRVRYVPFNGAGVVPADLAGGRGGERRRVAVTLGTVLTEMDGVRSIVRLIEHAAAVDAEFLLAIGGADLAPLGTLPPNVRPLPWVPLAQLLEASDAIIHHGGSGTMMTAASVGTPQLILPQGADHFENAAVAEASGFALRATADAVDGDLLDTLLNDDGLRKAAVALRAEIEALPSPAALVPDFEALAAAR